MSESITDTGERSAIKVVDRRRFSADGVVKADAPEQICQAATILSKPSNPPSPSSQAELDTKSESSIGFMSFIASLASNALAAMGALPEAEARGVTPSLPLAREYIEIIAMLQERTRNNVSTQESQSLHRLLSQLRLQFVECQSRANQGNQSHAR